MSSCEHLIFSLWKQTGDLFSVSAWGGGVLFSKLPQAFEMDENKFKKFKAWDKRLGPEFMALEWVSGCFILYFFPQKHLKLSFFNAIKPVHLSQHR